MKLLIDTNIFLEVLLEQTRANEGPESFSPRPMRTTSSSLTSRFTPSGLSC